MLEDLQDQGNLGTILRTAEALGVSQVCLLGECCDPPLPKALRVMGAVFRLSLWEEPPAGAAVLSAAGDGYTLLASVPEKGRLPRDRGGLARGKFAVFIGNEGNGLTEETIALCHSR